MPLLNLLILRKEMRETFSVKSTLTLWTVSTFLIGYSFIQAVELYSEASRAALQHPELSQGMSPFEGILVPTFGSLYLITTLLFPFVALRSISTEKQQGTLKLLLQLPAPFSSVLLTKFFSVFLCWTIATLPSALALIVWLVSGGHVCGSELLSLVLGHALYAISILGISFFVAAITESSATAALVILAVTLGSWVLDFAASSQTASLTRVLSFLSLTAGIRSFERGLVLSQEVLRFVFLGSLLTAATYFILVQLPQPPGKKWVQIGYILSIAAIFIGFASIRAFHLDLSEDRRNSFPKGHELILKQIPGEIKIRVALSPDDPRYKDFKKNVLSKLERTVQGLSVDLVSTAKSELFGVGSDESYGLNEYEYQGKIEKSRSTSPREILPILYQLAGLTPPEVSQLTYPGYPLVLDPSSFSYLFYLALPLLFLFIWWWNHRIPNFY